MKIWAKTAWHARRESRHFLKTLRSLFVVVAIVSIGFLINKDVVDRAHRFASPRNGKVESPFLVDRLCCRRFVRVNSDAATFRVNVLGIERVYRRISSAIHRQ